jgi:hypothetical protein
MCLNRIRSELKEELKEISIRIDEIKEYDVTATDDPKEQLMLSQFNEIGALLKSYYEKRLLEKESVLKKISLEGII